MLWSLVLLIIGLALVIGGVALLSPPAALIVAGVSLSSLALLREVGAK